MRLIWAPGLAAAMRGFQTQVCLVSFVIAHALQLIEVVIKLGLSTIQWNSQLAKEA